MTTRAVPTRAASTDWVPDYPMTGDPRVDSIALQRIDASTLKATTKKAGKVIGEYTAMVSTGGRTIKVNYTETVVQGNIYEGSEVYENL
jgi:hypothetical protein